MPNWGIQTALGTDYGLDSCRAMGGQFPDVSGATLLSVLIYIGSAHSEQLRLAVYQGGDLATGPDGADLIYDFGQISGTATDTWIQLDVSGGPYSLTGDTPTWVAFKGNAGTTDTVYSTSSADAEDFQSDRGRFVTGGEVSADPTVSYPDPWPTDSGSFAGYWYSTYLIYAQPSYKVEGVSKTQGGIVLPSCDCFLLKDNGDDTFTLIDHVVSNATTGVYSFTGLTDNDSAYMVIAWKDSVPHVQDVTDHVLTPVAE